MTSAATPSAPSSPKSTRSVATQALPELQADVRWGFGKSDARKLRQTGKIPAIAYGRGLPTTAISVAPKDILGILKSDRGRNSVVQMKVGDGQKLLVMIREYSYHPVARTLEHVDFVQVKLDEPVVVQVPLFYTGKAAGVVTGGIVRQVFRTLPVRCLPDRVPVKIEVDITHLNMSEHVSTQDLKLPEGVVVLLPAEQTLVAIVAPEKEREETAEAAAPGAAPAAGAAPAGGAAAPAAGAGDAAKAGDKAAAPAKDDKKKK